MGRLKAELIEDGFEIVGFTSSHDRPLYKGCMAISSTSVAIDKLLNEYHTSTVGDWVGIMASIKLLAFGRGLVLGGNAKVSHTICEKL